MPSIDVIEHLLEVHFRFVHPVLPMLHYSTLSDQIHRNESPPPHLLFAILGLASRFSDNRAFRVPQPGVERPPCTIFYERAKHFIKDEYDNSQIANVQTLLMMAVQQMGFCESQRAWLYVGMAIRMAQDLGLNKEPSEQELNRNRLQCELRKRTWWSLYIIDRLICAGLGRPLTITRKDCETGFPQQEDDMGDASFLGRTVERPTVIANFVHLITLTMVQGNILEFIKAKFSSFQKSKNRLVQVHSPGLQSDQERECHVDTSAAAFTALDKSLTEWRLGLPESLQNATPQSPHFGLFLHLTYNTLIILLHRPEASVSPMSASLCTQAAATISDITEILMDAKVLTSMFISCLYAIFSAGIVHFMNIPSVRKTEASSSTSSPVVSVTREIQSSHTLSAKTNLKRCIDALKFLASHWVSAARRAKVLEDLLDLKHVSLKDLEMDTFKTSPVGPSWVMESRYKEALVGPRENQDQLRQQCRSKVMAIHSLLANDDEFNKMQRRRSISFPDNDMDGDNIDDKDDDKDAKERAKDESTYIVKEDKHETGSGWQTDTCTRLASSIDNASVTTVTSENSRTPIGLGVLSPVSSAPSAASLVSIRNDNNSATLQQLPESDPAMVLSVSNFDISSSLTLGTLTATEEDGSDVAAATAAGLVRHENGLLTPMTMTTLAQGATSPLLVAASVRSEIQSPAMEGSRRDMSTANTGRRQGAMLDPFSMPSSIEFSERNHDRRSSHTHRTAASAASSPMISSIPGSAVAPPDSTSQPLSLFHESSTHDFPGSKTSRREEQDLVWNDMPPTLGLDEWTAYIGAMMMRWLYASGQSSPCSPTSL
ncbi:hypothetical protein EDD11_004648 [Mortierella claussenii]|nr:hypothetical protein EDD11_004648 [Mortierella claussenii]